MIIAVDAGKDTTKVAIKENGIFNTKTFRSRIFNISEHGDASLVDSSKTFDVEYSGHRYLVGEAGTQQIYQTSKTDEINKLCQYVAITRFLPPDCPMEIELITGCPASIYTNKELRKDYIENIRNNSNLPIKITVNDEAFEFTFSQTIKVRPEGSGISFLKPEWFVRQNTIVCDLGGQNLNITVYNNFVSNPEYMITRNDGGSSIEESLRNTFERYGLENLSAPIIRTAIDQRVLPNQLMTNEKSTEIINNEIMKYIDEINKNLNMNKLNVNLHTLVFIGGTSFMIKDFLLQAFPNAHFLNSLEESQLANVKGFYEMAEQ